MLRTIGRPTPVLATLVSAVLVVGATGTDCGFTGVIPGTEDDLVEIEMDNQTDFPVDPQLEISDDVVVIDPPLDPDELFPFETDCFEGDLISTDALAFIDGNDALVSENVPFVEEGFEFLCGDTVAFIFFTAVDPDTDELLLFTDVEINGQLLTDCQGCLP